MPAPDFDELDEQYAWLMGEIAKHETDQGQDIAPILVEFFKPKSVIDLGGAQGLYLAPLKELGIEVHCVDGCRSAIDDLRIDPEEFELFDLRMPYEPPKQHDLCLCIETLEHIAPEYAETVVTSITRCAPVALISAARPGQGGHLHLNEKPHAYWRRLFDLNGMVYDDDTSTKLIERFQQIPSCRRNRWLIWNTQVFRRNENWLGWF